MANAKYTGDRTKKRMRWIARGIGSLVGALWIFIGITDAIWAREPWTLEGAILSGLVIIAVLGVIIAWWREGLGGTVVVIGAIALSIFAYVTARFNKIWAMLISGGPFLVAGILFLASWQRSKRSEISQGSI